MLQAQSNRVLEIFGGLEAQQILSIGLNKILTKNVFFINNTYIKVKFHGDHLRVECCWLVLWFPLDSLSNHTCSTLQPCNKYCAYEKKS